MTQLSESEQLTERNIRTIYESEKAELENTPLSHKVANKIAAFSGTVTFTAVHIVAFSSWVLFNVFTSWKFDPYPFTFLTLVVSIEAIFLSNFILISQNLLAEHSERRNKLDLQINILAEEETTAILRFLDKLAEKIGIPLEERAEFRAMADNINPEKVLEQIYQIEERKG